MTRSAPGHQDRRAGSPLGLHRVLEPAGVLPQAAWRLDPDPVIGSDEVRIQVDGLNLDAASYRQLRESSGESAEAMRAAVLEIVAERGKMQNPVTGSGGMLTGVVEEGIGPIQQLFPDGWPMLFQVILDADDGHSVDARTTLIGPHLPQCCLQFSRSHTASINRFVLAGFSVPLIAPDDSVSSLPASRASPVSAEEKSSSIWIFCCLSSLRLMTYWPLLLVRAFGHRFRLGLSIAPPFGFQSASLALPTS